MIKMLKQFGFEHIGVIREIGEKFGRYLDVVMTQFVMQNA
jgi:L-amino acid N-acyltransferase YncA